MLGLMRLKQDIGHLSIIVPVYNVAKYLARCLDSMLVDNKFGGELICVNDGSTDNSLAILQEYSCKYDNVHIITQANSGLSVARNKGLDAASGEYVFFIDSDDWIFEGKLQEVLDRVNGEDVIYFNATRFFEESHTFEPVHEIAELNSLSGPGFLNVSDGLKRNMPMVCVQGALYKRSFLLQNHLYNEPGIYHEDSYFTPQVLLKAGSVSCVNICLYAYRIRQGSITTTVQRKHIEDMLFVCRGLYDIFKKEIDLDACFYQYVSKYYAVTITEAYSHNQAIHKFWEFSDSRVMLQYANNGLIRRMAKLSFVSPKLSYSYGQNHLCPIVLKIINRLL